MKLYLFKLDKNSLYFSIILSIHLKQYATNQSILPKS